MVEVIERVLPRLQEYSNYLNRPIYGRSILAWLKLALIYSFVIWLGIIGWRGYLFYQDYQALINKKNNKISQLNRLKASVKNYRQKIEDINLAYKEISKTFSQKKIALLKQKINSLVKEIKINKTGENIYPYNPYRFVTFNYPIRLDQFFGKLESVTIDRVNFTSRAVSDYKNALRGVYLAFLGLQEKNISGKVKIAFVGNKIALFFVKGSGALFIKGVGLKGLIGNAEKVPYFPTTTYFYRSSEKFPNLTQIFFGWDLEIKGEGLE